MRLRWRGLGQERLDFSCALFGPDGGLIANAPHIPVHLGAMQETVRFQISHLADKVPSSSSSKGFRRVKLWQGGMCDGDVILCNHPSAGGSHLPDLTVITPVYYKGSPAPVFFVANRGHHADIGGLVPGSMPPFAKSLDEEGAAFLSFKLVEKGHFRVSNLFSHSFIRGHTRKVRSNRLTRLDTTETSHMAKHRVNNEIWEEGFGKESKA